MLLVLVLLRESERARFVLQRREEMYCE